MTAAENFGDFIIGYWFQGYGCSKKFGPIIAQHWKQYNLARRNITPLDAITI